MSSSGKCEVGKGLLYSNFSRVNNNNKSGPQRSLLFQNKLAATLSKQNSVIPEDYVYNKNINKTKCRTAYDDMDKYLTRFRDTKKTDTRNITFYSKHKVYLFIVNYHHRNYTSALFIRNVIYTLFALYYPFDFDLLLIGPTKNDKMGVSGNGLPTRGYYSYHSLTVAFKMFPRKCGYTYSGYFLANDDSCLQPILLGRENHNVALSESWFKWTNYTHWMWNWKLNSNGIKFSQAFFDAVEEISESPSMKALCKFNKTKLRKGWGDFFYIPKSKISSFLKLEKVMFEHKVFLESAVPFIMQCLEAKVIVNCNHGKMLQRENCVHLHPVKYSRSEEKSICINRITNISLIERPNTW